jgi:hypothetical protein
MTVEIFQGVYLVVDDDGTVIGGYTDPGVVIDIQVDANNNVVGIVKV